MISKIVLCMKVVLKRYMSIVIVESVETSLKSLTEKRNISSRKGINFLKDVLNVERHDNKA